MYLLLIIVCQLVCQFLATTTTAPPTFSLVRSSGQECGLEINVDTWSLNGTVEVENSNVNNTRFTVLTAAGTSRIIHLNKCLPPTLPTTTTTTSTTVNVSSSSSSSSSTTTSSPTTSSPTEYCFCTIVNKTAHKTTFNMQIKQLARYGQRFVNITKEVDTQGTVINITRVFHEQLDDLYHGAVLRFDDGMTTQILTPGENFVVAKTLDEIITNPRLLLYAHMKTMPHVSAPPPPPNVNANGALITFYTSNKSVVYNASDDFDGTTKTFNLSMHIRNADVIYKQHGMLYIHYIYQMKFEYNQTVMNQGNECEMHKSFTINFVQASNNDSYPVSYQLFDDYVMWTRAKDKCIIKGGGLAMPKNSTLQTELMMQIGPLYGTTVWIGWHGFLTHNTTYWYDYYWLDTMPSYVWHKYNQTEYDSKYNITQLFNSNPWINQYKPNGRKDEYNCGILTSSQLSQGDGYAGLWDEKPCAQRDAIYVCEFRYVDFIPPVSPPTTPRPTTPATSTTVTPAAVPLTNAASQSRTNTIGFFSVLTYLILEQCHRTKAA